MYCIFNITLIGILEKSEFFRIYTTALHSIAFIVYLRKVRQTSNNDELKISKANVEKGLKKFYKPTKNFELNVIRLNTE